jgi:hypothetical protein
MEDLWNLKEKKEKLNSTSFANMVSHENIILLFDDEIDDKLSKQNVRFWMKRKYIDEIAIFQKYILEILQ